MPSDKRLSIITINWNNVNGLRKTLESVVDQRTESCEFVIVDGASTDGSVKVIENYQNYVDRWISTPKIGIYPDMNKGIAMATGTYCLFLNSGDWLRENGLIKALTQCTGEDIIYFDSGLSYGGTRFETYRYPRQLTMRNFYHATIGHQATLIKRELFDRLSYYNENNCIHSDYEFWIRAIIVGNCTCKYVNETITNYDMSGRSSRPDESNVREIDAILSRYLPTRVLADYDYWHKREKEMKVLEWYRQREWLYRPLVLIYKVVKNLKRTFRIQ